MTTLKRFKPGFRPSSDIQPWFLCALLVAIAPALHAIATWDLDGSLSAQAYAIRHYSFVVVLIELGVICLAARQGLSLKNTFKALPAYVSFLLGIWLICALAALFSTLSGLANAGFILARYAIHGFFFSALVHLLRNSSSFDITKWLAILSIGAAAYVGLLIIFCLLVPDPINFSWIMRVPSATNIRQIGNVVGIMAIAPMAIMLLKDKATPLQYALIFIIIFTFVTWTGSRATVLGLAVGIVAGLLLVRNFTTIRNVITSGISALVSVLISLLIPVPDPALGLCRLVSANIAPADLSNGRRELWGNTFHQVMQSPWIGHGSGRFRSEMGAIYGTEWNHPHNFILQCFYDWGFLGGSAALLLLLIFGLAIFQRRAENPVAGFMAIAAFVAICCTAMIDSPLFHPLPILVALALIAPAFKKPLELE